MYDNTIKGGKMGLSLINVHEKQEVAYWTRELGITEERLVGIVLATGTSVKSVRHHLDK